MTFFINKTDLALFILKGVVKSQVDINIKFFVHFHVKGLVSFHYLLVIATPTPSLVNWCTIPNPNSPNLSIGDVIFGANNTAYSDGPLYEVKALNVQSKFIQKMSTIYHKHLILKTLKFP